MTYRSSGAYGICDECGFKHRLSDLRKRWDGLMVCRADYEARHPQDLVRGRRDRQVMRGARPEAPDQFLIGDPLMSEDDLEPLQTDNYGFMTQET